MDLTVLLDKLFSEQRGYFQWSELLKFAEDHKEELSKKDKKRIKKISEKYRREHNKKHEDDPIRTEDLNPNIT